MRSGARRGGERRTRPAVARAGPRPRGGRRRRPAVRAGAASTCTRTPVRHFLATGDGDRWSATRTWTPTGAELVVHPGHRRQGIGGRCSTRCEPRRRPSSALGARRPAGRARVRRRPRLATGRATLWQLRRPLTDADPGRPAAGRDHAAPVRARAGRGRLGRGERRAPSPTTPSRAPGPPGTSGCARPSRGSTRPASCSRSATTARSPASTGRRCTTRPAADRRGLRARGRPVRAGDAARAGADRGRPALPARPRAGRRACSTWTTTTRPRYGSTSGSASPNGTPTCSSGVLDRRSARSPGRQPAATSRSARGANLFRLSSPALVRSATSSLPSSPAPPPCRRHLSRPASRRAGHRRPPGGTHVKLQRHGLIAGLVVGVLALSACGSDNNDSTAAAERQQRVRQRTGRLPRLRLRHAVLGRLERPEDRGHAVGPAVPEPVRGRLDQLPGPGLRRRP